MWSSIIQGAATLSAAILTTDAIRETVNDGESKTRKWLAVIILLVIIFIVVPYIAELHLPKNSAVRLF